MNDEETNPGQTPPPNLQDGSEQLRNILSHLLDDKLRPLIANQGMILSEIRSLSRRVGEVEERINRIEGRVRRLEAS